MTELIFKKITPVTVGPSNCPVTVLKFWNKKMWNRGEGSYMRFENFYAIHFFQQMWIQIQIIVFEPVDPGEGKKYTLFHFDHVVSWRKYPSCVPPLYHGHFHDGVHMDIHDDHKSLMDRGGGAEKNYAPTALLGQE
ncbi:hypothetical protein [Aquiflexum balticum]|uniref:hypothetical protein n=1 Tax=Aquiflexum balticum TaxID=280473 RepID=UPI000A0762B2|nr:hypothetical protein [Aquiflexum balticum]